MTATFQPEEALLLAHILSSPALAARGLTVERGATFGVAVLRHGALLGLWGYDGNSYVFRQLSSWEPVAKAKSVEDALTLTLGFGRLP